MIRAVFSGTTLRVQGHAGAAPYGQDLVCAAVSSLVYALAQRIRELDEQGALKTSPRIRLDSGSAVISATARKKYRQQVAEDFRLTESGLKLLSGHYPEQVTVG